MPARGGAASAASAECSGPAHAVVGSAIAVTTGWQTRARRGGLMSSTVTDVKAYQWYAGGQWCDVATGQMFDDFEPYTGNLYARVADCGGEEARLEIAAAHEAFGRWADTPPVEKARLFFKAAEIVRRRRPEVAEILARETGSTIPFSTFQQDLVASTLEQAANWVYLPKGEVLASNLADTHSIGVRRPLGVLASRVHSLQRRRDSRAR